MMLLFLKVSNGFFGSNAKSQFPISMSSFVSSPSMAHIYPLTTGKSIGNCVTQVYVKIDINLKCLLPKINITFYHQVISPQKNELQLKMAT